MASAKIIAKRYSKALFELATEAKENPKSFLSSLSKLSAIVQANTDLKSLVNNPTFSFEEKWGVLSEILSKETVNKNLMEFVKTLIRTDRFRVLNEITNDFKARVLNMENSVEAFIETATQLNPEDLATLTISLERLFKRKIFPEIKVNPALVAGVKIKVLGKTLDASLASSLKAIQKKLITAQA